MAWHKTSRQERGYGASWDRVRKQVMKRDCGLCQPCKQQGRLTRAVAVDHITDKAQGGTDDPANLQAICEPCHTAKTMAAQGKTLRAPKAQFDGDGRVVW